MKKIAIPVYGDRISNRLDCSENIMLITVENGVIKKRETIRLVPSNLSTRINMFLILEIDVLICNGITKFYSHKLNDSNIKVIPWISGEIEETLTRYLEGKLITKNFQNKKRRKKKVLYNSCS